MFGKFRSRFSNAWKNIPSILSSRASSRSLGEGWSKNLSIRVDSCSSVVKLSSPFPKVRHFGAVDWPSGTDGFGNKNTTYCAFFINPYTSTGKIRPPFSGILGAYKKNGAAHKSHPETTETEFDSASLA